MSTKQRRQTGKKTMSSRSSRPAQEDAADRHLARKGQRLYQTKLKALLEPTYNGMFAAIEVDSGDYFLGARMIEAVDKAEAKHPDKLVYIVRIGSPAAVKMRNRMHI